MSSCSDAVKIPVLSGSAAHRSAISCAKISSQTGIPLQMRALARSALSSTNPIGAADTEGET